MVNILNRVSTRKKSGLGLLLAASLAVLPACAGPEETTVSEEANVTTEELTEGAEGLIGQSISTRGELKEVIGEAAFLMNEEGTFNGEDILVLNASGMPLFVPEVGDSEVQVTGEVQQLIIADIETEYGLDLDPELYADYEDRPVIIAQSVALSPDPGELTSNPDMYYNQRIAVEGEVEEILSPTAFTLDEEQLFGGEDLLVITQMATPETQDDEIVTVVGVMRPYIAADFEKDYDLQWDLSTKEEIEAEYSEKPVFVADEVYPSAVPE
ncbi:MAG: hypothetical protein F6J97_21915 [Leptolyngbya sp. SIO4C1]|nr:hypothetical protein [Leptolyngbya sp. SIO4C1]